jgi:hypothetical protein
MRSSATFEASLRKRLLERVRASHAHESQFLTVRRDGGDWHVPAPGVRERELARTDVAQSLLVELAAGAALPVAEGVGRVEVVVLDGAALLGATPLACGVAASAPNDAAHSVCASDAGARLYVRRSFGQADPRPVACFSTADDNGWDDFCPGVRIRELDGSGERRSVLVRMRAGASVNAHGHALEEECMMLAGEAFIGDTLLRCGEYQLAPMGSRHGAVSTDVGAVFFVNGSLDPSAYA